MLTANESEKKLERRLVTIITSAGYKINKVKYSSFSELEESLSIEHYKLTGSNDERCGHITFSLITNNDLEEEIKKDLK